MKNQKHLLFALLTIACTLFFIPVSSYALSWNMDANLDREIGILDRPWKISLIRIATRDYLRNQSRLQTGFPVYDQQRQYIEQYSGQVEQQIVVSSPRQAVNTNSTPTPVLANPGTTASGIPVLAGPGVDPGSSSSTPSVAPPSPPTVPGLPSTIPTDGVSGPNWGGIEQQP